VIVADFSREDAAKPKYEALKEIDGETVEIEGVLVVKRESDGDIKVQKMTDHSTRHGIGWGAVGGLVVDVLFPPSVVGAVLVGSLGGAAVGGIRKHHHKKEVADELDAVLKVGHSGLVVLVSAPDEPSIEKALDEADSIVSKAIDQAAADASRRRPRPRRRTSPNRPGHLLRVRRAAGVPDPKQVRILDPAPNPALRVMARADAVTLETPTTRLRRRVTVGCDAPSPAVAAPPGRPPSTSSQPRATPSQPRGPF